MQHYRSGTIRTSRGLQARRHLRFLGVVGLTAALCIGTVPSASADKDHRAFPSKHDVLTAKQNAETKARDVGAIKASLLLANQRLEDAGLRAEQASEAYNGALWRLQLAKDKAREARADAAEARRTVTEQRDAIGALVATAYQQGTEISSLSAMMSAKGPEGVLDQYVAFQGASTSLQADYDRFAAAESIAQVYEQKAQQARKEQARLADKARAAKELAASAALAAQAAADQIAAQKEQLIHELAQAQDISFRLARQRQGALEEIALERAEAQARAEAEAAAKRQQAKAEAEARARAKAAAAAKRAQRRENRQNDTSNIPAPVYTPPAPAPVVYPPAPSHKRGARRAVEFAKAQLGDMYLWGAAGPDRWDCSGLMMGAWAAAGVALPHYSAAQYAAGTPISSLDLRRGDLVFWGTTNNPTSIHHVAIYIGHGLIIHAPRTGQPVQISSMYYWIPPNFFARV